MINISIFNIVINLIYTLSALYFLFANKSIMNFGLSIFCIITGLLIEFFRKKSIIKTTSLSVVCSLFILFSTLLGTCFGFYGAFKGYDDFLHIWSGFITVSIAYNLLLTTNKDGYKLSALFIVIYLFMFSMGVASIWEIIEFTIDSTLGMNTQAGGLVDTITDMIDALIGSIIMVIFYYKSHLVDKSCKTKSSNN
ncbi:hypothetical protein [Romboutsia sp.]|uniref:hypothetical protein n=1 Tax=Romboutsia sp. TaxID=1965302 RepID=UPI003F32CA9C